MKISDFVKWAKQAQSTLKENGVPAKHIYLSGYSDPGVIPSLIFVSDDYNEMDLYERSKISTAIQKAPFKYNFYILGDKHLAKQNSPVSREHIFNSIKLYGKTPLIIDGVEFASKEDLNISTKDTVRNNTALI
jgi:hypothetical protein